MADIFEPTKKKNENIKVGGKTGYIEVNMTLPVATLAANYLLADTQVIQGALSDSLGTGIIHCVTLLDKDDQAGAIDVIFLRTNVSMGTENAAFSPTDAVADEIVGVVEIVSTDYVDLTNSQIACKNNLGMGFKGDDMQKLYVALVSRDTKTYTANGITLKIVIFQD